jgi:hypothetical protein
MTLKQSQRAFGIAHMTLHNWRAAEDPLPVVTDPNSGQVKPRVYVPISKAKQWAKRNGVEFAVQPEVAAEDGDLKRTRTKH